MISKRIFNKYSLKEDQKRLHDITKMALGSDVEAEHAKYCAQRYYFLRDILDRLYEKLSTKKEVSISVLQAIRENSNHMTPFLKYVNTDDFSALDNFKDDVVAPLKLSSKAELLAFVIYAPSPKISKRRVSINRLFCRK